MLKKINNLLIFFIEIISVVFRPFWSEGSRFIFTKLKKHFITNIIKKRFKKFGAGSLLSSDSVFKNLCYVEVGSNSTIGPRATITCYKQDKKNKDPELIIFDNVTIGSDCHISCANKIEIGEGVLTGKYVLISDNSHGEINEILNNTMPIKRPVFSKGKINIKENVWIGDKVTILPGVTIGKNSIIGTGSIVTKDIPSYSVAVGSPAKTIKKL